MGKQQLMERTLALTMVLLLLAACAPATPEPTATPTIAPATATNTAISTPTEAPTQSPTPTPSETPTPTIPPTYVDSLRAKVIVDGRLTCRFGPGEPYLYKFTFAGSANIELVGRMEYSNWVLARAIGGTNRCWVDGGPDTLQISGDPMTLPPVDAHIVLAWSSYYGPMSNVFAVRDRVQPSLVTVSYSGLVLEPSRGDESEQTPYILEAWVCQDGEFKFIAVGSYAYAAEVIDEPGCSQPSHGRVAAAEKHGYTPFVEVPWPEYPPAQ